MESLAAHRVRAHMTHRLFRVNSQMSRILIIIGLVILGIGLLWPLLTKLGLGRLPGDFVIERDNFTLYLPIGTCVVISIVLSIVFWLLNR